MECLAVAAAAGPVRCHVHRRAAYAFRRAGTVHAAADRHAGQSGGDRLGGDPGGQAARVRRGIRDGQGRRRPAGPGRGGAQLREHGVASTAMHPAAVPPRASCNTPTAWTWPAPSLPNRSAAPSPRWPTTRTCSISPAGRSASMLRPSRTGSTYGVDPPAARSPQCAALTVTTRAGRLLPHPEQPDMRG